MEVSDAAWAIESHDAVPESHDVRMRRRLLVGLLAVISGRILRHLVVDGGIMADAWRLEGGRLALGLSDHFDVQWSCGWRPCHVR